MNENTVPIIPCKECLVRVMCRSRLRMGLLSLSLNCSILNKWLQRDGFGNVSIDRLYIAYNELSLTGMPDWGNKT